MEKALQIVGFGTPFISAAATFWVFQWLDRNASARATRSVSAWLKSSPLKQLDVGDATISLFDRVYSFPLFGRRAFYRSAIISLVIWSFFTVRPLLLTLVQMIHDGFPGWVLAGVIFKFTLNTAAIVISDYLSLFAVRATLNISTTYPVRAMFLTFVSGGVAIFIAYGIYLALASIMLALLLGLSVFEYTYEFFSLTYYKMVYDYVSVSPIITTFMQSMRPAFVVHLWLPLLGLASLIVRFLYLLFHAVHWAQWFLKQGDRHPLKAIGMVAAVLG